MLRWWTHNNHVKISECCREGQGVIQVPHTFWTEVLSLTSLGGYSSQAVPSCLSRGDMVKPPTWCHGRVLPACGTATRNEMTPWKTHLFVVFPTHCSMNHLGFALNCKDLRLARASWTHWAFERPHPRPFILSPRHNNVVIICPPCLIASSSKVRKHKCPGALLKYLHME